MKISEIILQKHINQYRSKTYRFSSDLNLNSKKDAIDFVNERGYIFFWPIKGIDLPSLWCAVAGNRPVPNNHDDPGHITWRWKDDLLGKKKWYYAKILRRKSTIISLKMIPCFFALSQFVYEGLDEINFLYKQGKITSEEKQIYSSLINSGPLDTIALRNQSQSTISTTASRFNRALESLQRDFRIVPSGISQNGRWNYSYIYQTVQNVFPDLIEQSLRINKEHAFNAILQSFFRSNGIGTMKEIQKIFGWDKREIHKTINSLISSGAIKRLSSSEDMEKEIFTIPELL